MRPPQSLTSPCLLSATGRPIPAPGLGDGYDRPWSSFATWAGSLACPCETEWPLFATLRGDPHADRRQLIKATRPRRSERGGCSMAHACGGSANLLAWRPLRGHQTWLEMERTALQAEPTARYLVSQATSGTFPAPHRTLYWTTEVTEGVMPCHGQDAAVRILARWKRGAGARRQRCASQSARPPSGGQRASGQMEQVMRAWEQGLMAAPATFLPPHHTRHWMEVTGGVPPCHGHDAVIRILAKWKKGPGTPTMSIPVRPSAKRRLPGNQASETAITQA
ncbi:uncharacterized protein B0I36DRAFT_41341 [Microdochium trichocladiopsis]|uniref:Uncharacterized protein n=1 Tax=Microdochium trichocladiopsis TaxID=1682393 RepID=A0A9P9BIT8_9PEZI|nr:uncharacterized protein B0I36DRAFT_41341 [Microdochium trichocladiopsis]KAH7016013.1 hypothetical protein B0I36DRAFT_41341 [Microdochium trichocladiopsis]